MPTPSIKSTANTVKKFFTRNKNPGGSPFTRTSRVERPSPAPVLTGPSSRAIKPEEAKAESKGTDNQKAESKDNEREEDKDMTDKIVKTTHGPSKPMKTESNQMDLQFGKDNFKHQDKITEERISTKSAYSKVWAFESGNTPQKIQYTEYSTFVPNAISLAITVAEIERTIENNIVIEEKYKKYISLAFRQYCFTMYYVRILMIMEVFRLNSTANSTWLRKFLREHPPATLPIPGPLEPIFGALSAYAVFEDNRQTWMIPTLPSDLFDRLMNVTNDDDNQWKLTQPNTMILFDFMRVYCQSGNTALQLDTPANNVNGEFAAFIATNTITVGGRTINQAHNDLRHRLIFAGPATCYPLPESATTLEDRRRFWRNSKMRVYSHGTGTAIYTAANDHFTIPQMLCLADIPGRDRCSFDMDWFNEPIAMTNIACKFLTDTTNFGALDFEGGPEVAIRADVKIFSPRNTLRNEIQTDAIYTAAGHTSTIVPDLSTKSWYPRLYDNGYGNFDLYTPDTSINCYYNAKHTLLNARLVFYLRLDTATNNDVTQLTCLSTNIDVGANRRLNAGPFFGTHSDGEILEDGQLCTIWSRTYDFRTQVFTDRVSLIRDGFYVDDGSA